MPNNNTNIKYCEYFDVDEKYFPCIDESAINNGAPWNKTFPHETFLKLLKDAESMLSGKTNRSLWIHGAYGTGKSQCAYTLMKLLEVSEDEARQYWNSFEPLKRNSALLEKILGHKAQGIVTAYRYASGSIVTPQKLFFAVQESVKKALERRNIPYKGENTLKESVIQWLKDGCHNRFINDLLQKPKWHSVFSQSTADEIIDALCKQKDVSELIDNIFLLAGQEGITALDLTADSLRNWLVDVIDNNKIKLVLIWDEFSDYFRQNANSLGEFQKIVSLCQEKPFYFVIVTHPVSSLIHGYAGANGTNPWSVVQQRFDKVEIALPDNIAFDLIGHAFNVKTAAKAQWNEITNVLNKRVFNAGNAVNKAVCINDPETIRKMLPIHPIAALVLKNIASGFQSNQRSMFDFIKLPKDTDAKAFEWFIANTTPFSDRSVLTVDMLWDFFYEKGKDYLSADIKLILDTFSLQTQLNEKEKIVLKTVLIMQAIDQRLGGSIPILKPTDQNLSYAFAGDCDELENSCKNIAKELVRKGILIENPVGNGKIAYSAAVLAGDGVKIDAFKKEIRKESEKMENLLKKAPDIASALSLSPALKLRYAADPQTGRIPVAAISDFKRLMDALKNKDVDWHFYAVLALAKTEEESSRFRSLIKETIADPSYKNIAIIDALSTPLGEEAFEQYVDYSAMAKYYCGNNNKQAREYEKKANDVLEIGWKKRIGDGQFIVCSYADPDGEKANGAANAQKIMQTIVRDRFPYVQDFANNLTEAQLKLTQAKKSAQCGIDADSVAGIVKGCEKSVLGKVWQKMNYWEAEELSDEPVVIIKKTVDKLIAESFKKNGKISVKEIFDCLETDFGFSVCNMSAFIAGFLLKEYSADPFRSMDEDGTTEKMTPGKLSEMIANCIGKSNPKLTYIVSLTEEERAFCALTETAWNIPPDKCGGPTQASFLVQEKMHELGYPVWCLKEIDADGVFDIVELYARLVQSKGDDAHKIANEIGKIASRRKTSADSLKALLTTDICAKGMKLFLERFENGRLPKIADEIGASSAMLTDVKKLFAVQCAALWSNATGENEIRKLLTEYEIIRATNALLNASAHNKDEAYRAWRDTLNFIGFSCESVKAKHPELGKFLDKLLQIAKCEDMLPDAMNCFLNEMTNLNAEIKKLLGNPTAVFQEAYAPYLEGFSDAECEEIKNRITENLFIASSSASNAAVKKAAETYRKDQIGSRLSDFWRQKTGGTKNPRDWSEKHRTPILCCVGKSRYAEAKRAFSALCNGAQNESQIKEALSFLENQDSAGFFADIASQTHRDDCFRECIIGNYAELLPDEETVRTALEATGISAYEWNDNPAVKDKVKRLASAEYNAGGSDKVIDIICKMSDAELKQWLTDVVCKDMDLGVKIIVNTES